MHGPLGSRQLGSQTKGARMQDYIIKGTIWHLVVKALRSTELHPGCNKRMDDGSCAGFLFLNTCCRLARGWKIWVELPSHDNPAGWASALAEYTGSKDDLPMQPGKEIQLLQVKQLWIVHQDYSYNISSNPLLWGKSLKPSRGVSLTDESPIR